jgi:septum formation protein
MVMSDARLILASQSASRKAMLGNAGLVFTCQPADLDERAVLAARGNLDPIEMAGVLAAEKALAVSRDIEGALVIGSDQILECDGEILHKATNLEDARAKLAGLRGKTHRLISAVSVTRGDDILWQDSAQARLTMHDFDDAFLDEYCARAGAALTRSVGAYELESLGVQLFDAIDGDYFTILGMPLLRLLTYLRDEHGVGL